MYKPYVTLIGTAVILAGLALVGFARQDGAEARTKPNPGKFSVSCEKRWEGNRDPIVSPGQPSAHKHVGAGGPIRYDSDRQSLVASRSTTCTVGGDRSGYWVPAAEIRGVEIDPREINAYYGAAPGVDPQRVSLPPVGWEVLAGRADADGPQNEVRFGCARNARGGSSSPVPVDCRPGDIPTMHFTFPSCSSGARTSEDHYSHAGYVDEAGNCPPGMRHVLQLTMAVRYPYTPNFSELRLSSDHGDHGNALSAHADWLDGWVRKDMQRLTQRCVKRGPGCGLQMSVDMAKK